jgi:hypothetical protein
MGKIVEFRRDPSESELNALRQKAAEASGETLTDILAQAMSNSQVLTGFPALRLVQPLEPGDTLPSGGGADDAA